MRQSRSRKYESWDLASVSADDKPVPLSVVVPDVAVRRTQLNVQRATAQSNTHLYSAVLQRYAHFVLSIACTHPHTCFTRFKQYSYLWETHLEDTERHQLYKITHMS